MRLNIRFKVRRSCGHILPLANAKDDLANYRVAGVMRFLQTEWHRHERDRNAWEIEKQEMKGRIASLEGAARRADATQKALKKYVSILEKKVKEQSAQLKPSSTAAAPTGSEPADKQQQAAKILEKLRGKCHLLPLTILALDEVY